MELMAKFCSWFLTSTDRGFRDKTTKALYWFGRRFPEKLFELTIDSLSVNDPYVPERMLAASYGVIMALHSDRKNVNFLKRILPQFAKKLFEMMFKRGGLHSTTHILMRDYARHSIEVALPHHRGLLNAQELKRIRPPFLDGGIRKWGKSKDRNEGEYREGNSPMGWDFSNYTLGHLVPDRNNYDFQHKGYQIVKANMFWRIYKLGYSLNRFGEIDKDIARYRWFLRDGNKVDRYGKKYCWIAFYEIAGYREDKGILKNEWRRDTERTSDVDIDPSFPELPSECKVVKSSFLGDKSQDLEQWIVKGDDPNPKNYLILNQLRGQEGPWVLLEGYIDQEDLGAKRKVYVLVRGLLTKRKETRSLLKALSRLKPPGDRLIPDPEGDYYTFAGEIPWSETFSYQTKKTVVIITSSRVVKVPTKEMRFLKGDHELGEDDWQRLADILTKCRKDEKALKRCMADMDLKIAEVKSFREEIVQKKREFETLLPLRYFNWEGYHSISNPAQHTYVPSKELCTFLNLSSRPQTFDMFDESGKKATITVRWGTHWHNFHQLLYIKQDLLERFLKANKLDLVWVIWGERRFWSKDLTELPKFAKKHQHYKVYHATVTYSQTKKQVTAKKMYTPSIIRES